jgi:hypothetical protein
MTKRGVLQHQWPKVNVSLTFVSKGKRRMDIDNAIGRCKALLDGISDGLGINDKHFNLSAQYGSGEVGVHVKVESCAI